MCICVYVYMCMYMSRTATPRSAHAKKKAVRMRTTSVMATKLSRSRKRAKKAGFETGRLASRMVDSMSLSWCAPPSYLLRSSRNVKRQKCVRVWQPHVSTWTVPRAGRMW